MVTASFKGNTLLLNVFNIKYVLRAQKQNVRSLYGSVTTIQLKDVLEKYKADITAIQKSDGQGLHTQTEKKTMRLRTYYTIGCGKYDCTRKS